jgi:hypothetical protein
VASPTVGSAVAGAAVGETQRGHKRRIGADRAGALDHVWVLHRGASELSAIVVVSFGFGGSTSWVDPSAIETDVLTPFLCDVLLGAFNAALGVFRRALELLPPMGGRRRGQVLRAVSRKFGTTSAKLREKSRTLSAT